MLLLSLGGSADVCELKSGDEILTINGADVTSHYMESIQSVISQAVAHGQLELRVRRLIKHSKYPLICYILSLVWLSICLHMSVCVGRAQLYRLSLVNAHTVAQNQYTGNKFYDIHLFCHGIVQCAEV